MGAAIRLENISRKFGQFTAVDNVNLEVMEGEFLTLLGSSGSGKTTTLRLIAGLEMPTSGQILFNGQDITDVPATARNMRMVFQDYALFPNLSVAENVAFGLKLRCMKGHHSKETIATLVERHLVTVHLAGQGHKMPHQLSGGQKQRVALARALITDPPVVLFDEPLGSLDANLRKIMQMEIKRLHRELGKTFVYVTHDQEEAMAMSSRVAVMKNSQLLQVGTPDQIYFQPDNTDVARFIGAANVVTGQVKDTSAGAVTVDIGDNITLKTTRNSFAPANGERVGVMMRGESFIFSGQEAGGRTINWISGRIVEKLFLGQKMEYEIVLQGATEPLSVIDRQFQNRGIDVGQNVTIGIYPEDIRLLQNTAS